MESRREKRLIDLARNGVDDAYRELVEANMRHVYGLALRYTGRHEDADDVAQETFIRAYRSLGRFKGDSRFGTWVHRIAVNCCLTLRRKRGRVAAAELPEEAAKQGASGSGPSQERAVLGTQTRAFVRRALDELSEQQRAVFVMKHMQHKKITEIADILGCAEGTVKQQLFRAVRKVRDYLAPLLGRQEVAK